MSLRYLRVVAHGSLPSYPCISRERDAEIGENEDVILKMEAK